MAAMLPIIALYLWGQQRRQRTSAIRHPFVDSRTVVADYRRRQGLTIRLLSVFLVLAAASGLIAWWAWNRSDVIFVVAAVGAIIFLALVVYSGTAGFRCPICNAAALSWENFCTSCGARLR